MTCEKKLAEIKQRLGKAKYSCVTCASSVGVHSDDEGTSSYEPLLRTDVELLVKMVEYVGQHLTEYCLCSGDGQPDGVTCVHCDALAELDRLAGEVK